MIEIVFKLDENKAIAYDSEKKVGECDFEEIDDIFEKSIIRCIFSLKNDIIWGVIEFIFSILK